MIKLLSTDFDGTLVDHFAQPPVAPELIELFTELQGRGVLWAVNTGRTLWHIVEGLEEFQFPIQPDFVLTTEREVFHRGPSGRWEDLGDWNARCNEAHEELFAEAAGLFEEITRFLDRHAPGSTPIYEDGQMIGLCAATDQQMDRIIEFLDAARERMPLFSYQRNTIYLRFCHAHYSKGAALGELARITGLPREAIFAAGDHHNDLSMLDGRHARWVACPGNSVEAVKETVRRAGGYVARETCGLGVVEALRHFLARSTALHACY